MLKKQDRLVITPTDQNGKIPPVTNNKQSAREAVGGSKQNWDRTRVRERDGEGRKYKKRTDERKRGGREIKRVGRRSV